MGNDAIKNLVFYLVCVLIIILGILATGDLIKTFRVTNAEYGTVQTLETKQDYDILTKYDFGFMQFDKQDNEEFVFEERAERKDFNGEGKELRILLNNKPAFNVEVKPGEITGKFRFKFKNTEGAVDTTANLSFVIKFYDAETVIQFSMINESNSVGYFERYCELNGAELKIVSKN